MNMKTNYLKLGSELVVFAGASLFTGQIILTALVGDIVIKTNAVQERIPEIIFFTSSCLIYAYYRLATLKGYIIRKKQK